jgi:S-adenosyl-L-methionine hydrolase (adenosine-forming)
MASRLITLTTDYGYQDPFVGIMKGVIFGINPDARVIDLSHGIPPQDLMAAALVLRHSTRFFPRGTIHVTVVDPGVGTDRRALLVESEGDFFIGPDNGILSLAIEGREASEIIDLRNEVYHLKPTSTTFHGRDIFAAVAGYLSLGIPAQDFGTRVNSLKKLAWPEVTKSQGTIQGRIVYVDRFGNLITNVQERDLKPLQKEKVAISTGNLTIHGLSTNYHSGAERGYVALINSWGLLEISLFEGNAQLRSGAKVGDGVQIQGGQS